MSPLMLNDRKTPLAFLSTRRSGKPRDLGAPGPDAVQLDTMLAIAARTPDHGKLAPWRFVVIAERARFAALLADAFLAAKPDARPDEITAQHQFAHQAPTLVAVIATPDPASPIPAWEQEASAGAACMNLLHAANATGFAGGWLTGWAAYADAVRDALCPPGVPDAQAARIVGFVFIGTPTRPLDERPRPDMGRIVSHW